MTAPHLTSLSALGVAVLTLCSVSSAVDVSVTSSLSFDAVAAKSRPVTKVVTLLKDMLVEMEKEATTDEDVYDKISCWCETNDKVKTKAIKDGEYKVSIILPKIEALAQLSAKLQTEIHHMGEFDVKLQGSMDKAIAIHTKELSEWHEEEKDLLQSISALKAAIIVLSKHHSGALLQTAAANENANAQKTQIASAALTLQQVLEHNASLLRGVLGPKQKRELITFLKTPADYFEASSTLLQSKQKYAPQSGEITGILKQMLETFSKNLSEGQTDMEGTVRAYTATKASLELEITSNKEMLDKKTVELADTNEKLALLQIDLIETKKVLEVNYKFIKMLKEKCQMTDQEWEARQKMRAEEVESISKALAILNSDDAQQTFSRTFNFLQESWAGADRGLQSQVAKLLKAEADKYSSPRLAAFAMRIRLDAFTKVKAAINHMIAELTKEKGEEIQHKNFCVDEFHANEMQTTKKEQEKLTITAQIEDLKMTVEKLANEIAELKASVADMQLQMKRSGEDRQKEHNEFQVIVADQRATEKYLAQAIGVLEKFYSSTASKSVALAQGGADQQALPPQYQDQGTVVSVKQTVVYESKEVEVAGPPPPSGFSTYKKKTGVLPMLEDILADAKAMEAETIRDEENAQKAYEDFVMETNASIEASTREIVTKSGKKAKLEADLIEAEEALDNVELGLEQLGNYNLQLHTSCDYILKNFESRQENRDGEIDALKQALAILSGAKFSDFLQKGY